MVSVQGYTQGMIIRHEKTTKEDQKYFEKKGKVAEAANKGKLGKSWYRWDEQKKTYVLSPKKNYGRV